MYWHYTDESEDKQKDACPGLGTIHPCDVIVLQLSRHLWVEQARTETYKPVPLEAKSMKWNSERNLSLFLQSWTGNWIKLPPSSPGWRLS